MEQFLNPDFIETTVAEITIWFQAHIFVLSAVIQFIVIALAIDGQSTASIPNFLIPIVAYILTLLIVGIDEARRWKKPSLFFGVPMLLILLHTSFSAGLLFGIFRSGKTPRDRIP